METLLYALAVIGGLCTASFVGIGVLIWRANGVADPSSIATSNHDDEPRSVREARAIIEAALRD